MAFNRTEKSGKGTFLTRLGEGAIQWSKVVKETSPGVYPQLILGQLVALDDTTGEIVPVADAITPPIGTVMVVNDERNGQKATVMLNAVATIRTSAAAALDYNEYVNTFATNGTTGLPVATAATTGQLATAITLGNAAAAADEVIVALLPAPVRIP